MKGNYESLVTFAQEIERQEQEKNDLLVPQEMLSMPTPGSLYIENKGVVNLTDYAHGQLAQKLNIPKKYYDYAGEIPGLREKIVGHMFQHQPDERKLIRTLDGRARAILSDRFKPIDNYLVMQALMPTFREHRDLEVKSLNMSDTRMYLQIVFPKFTGEVKQGDAIQYGVTIRNSEVGNGAYEIEELIWRLICSNGAIGSSIMRKYHVGRSVGGNEDDYNIFRDDTIRVELQSMQLRTRDVFAHAISETGFQEVLGKLRRADKDVIEKPKLLIENVTKRWGFSEDQSDKLLGNLISEGRDNMSRYGLVNSITALAKEIENPDKAYEMERIGNDVIELKPSEWEVLAS